MKKITFLAIAASTIGFCFGQQNQNNDRLVLKKGRWFLAETHR